jgi:type I restriction enzyme S subunit
MLALSTRTIDNVTETLIDYRGNTPPKTASGVRLITAKVIKDGFILEGDNEFIAEDYYEKWMRRGLPRQWDILITTEAPLGEVAQLRTGERVALAQRVILLRGKAQVIDQAYFFHALKSPFVQSELKARATGTTVLGIKQSELRQVRIPYYPLPIQQKIAPILSAYDDLIENNLRRIKILEEMAQAIYREWFVHFRFPGHENIRMIDSFIGPVPEGWSVMKVTEAIFVNPQTFVPKQGKKPFVPMNSLANDLMLIEGTQYRAGNNGSKFRNDDTLFARITPCLENGKTGFVQFLQSEHDTAFGSTEFIILRSKLLCPEYVYLMGRSEAFRDHAIKSMSGATGRQRVQEACFEQFLIAHPDRQTIEAFHATVSPIFKSVHLLACKNAALRQTRDLLLPKLISGEVDVSELEIDEGNAVA